MEELRIKIKLDFKDFLNFQYGYLRKRFANRLLLIGSILLFITVLLPVFLGQSIGHLEQFIPSFIFILFIPTLLIVATYYAAKKNFDNDPQLRKEQSYIFDSSGIQFSTESSQMKYRWDELFKFDESKSNLLIYCSPLKSFILPKNQLSEQEIIWLRELCSLNIKKQAFGTNSIFPTKVRIVIIIVPILIGVFIGLYPKSQLDILKENK